MTLMSLIFTRAVRPVGGVDSQAAFATTPFSESVSAKWQAARWPGAISRSGGGSRPAAIRRVAAARVEGAAGRRVAPGRRPRPAGGCARAAAQARIGHRAPPRAAPRCRGAAARRRAPSVGAELDDAADIHHRDTVGDVLDDREVVRDEEVGEVELVLQVLQQVERLRLHRDVERRDRLVGDDEARVERERAGDADALALAAGEGVRIAAHVFRPQPDAAHERRRRGPRSSLPLAMPLTRSGSPMMSSTVMRGLSEDERVLEDHADVAAVGASAPASPASRGRRRRLAVAAAIEDRAAGRLVDAQDARGRVVDLAAAGLADEAERLAVAHAKLDAVDGLHRGRPCGEAALRGSGNAPSGPRTSRQARGLRRRRGCASSAPCGPVRAAGETSVVAQAARLAAVGRVERRRHRTRVAEPRRSTSWQRVWNGQPVGPVEGCGTMPRSRSGEAAAPRGRLPSRGIERSRARV